jgi:uncharacterized protein DUF6011
MQTISHKFLSLSDARAYTLAGNATITLESLKTGAHFTFKVRAPKLEIGETRPEPIRFVSVLNGTDNETSYIYLGLIGKDGQFRLTKNSKAGADAPSVKAFSYFWNARELPAQLVVRHNGHCGRCGRTLTVPESIDAGIGPECASKIGGDL